MAEEHAQDKLSERLDEFYQRHLKHLEKTNPGETVAVDLDTGDWIVGPDGLTVWKQFVKKFGKRKHIELVILGDVGVPEV